MNQKETTAIALKCFAIYLLSQACISLPVIASIGIKMGNISETGISTTETALILIFTIIFAAISFFLLWKTANSVLAKTRDDAPAMAQTDRNSTMKLVLICMGIFFIMGGIVQFPAAFVRYRIMAPHAAETINMPLMNLLTPMIQILVGCGLIAKPSQWVKLLRSIGEK